MIRALPALLLLLFAACTDRDAPRPVPVPDRQPPADLTRPLSSRESLPPSDAGGIAPSASVDPHDPAEPGISDLARLARYVFRTMQQHEEVCPIANPFRDRLHFAFEIEVAAGRMVQVGLGHVGLEAGTASSVRTLTEAQWPPELAAYVSCLEPHLEALTMAPSPADGAYEPVYTFEGSAGGRPAP